MHIQIVVAEKALAAANLWVGRVTVWRRAEEKADGRATRMQRAMEAMAGDVIRGYYGGEKERGKRVPTGTQRGIEE